MRKARQNKFIIKRNGQERNMYNLEKIYSSKNLSKSKGFVFDEFTKRIFM